MAIDLIFLAIVIFGVLKGQSTGLIDSVLNISKIFLALILALKLGGHATGLVINVLHINNQLVPIVAIGVVFVIAMLSLGYIGEFLTANMDKVGLGFLNKYGGMAFWVFLMTLFFSTGLYYADYKNMLVDEVKRDSVVYGPVQHIYPTVANKLQTLFPKEEMLDRFQRYFTDVKEKAAEESDEHLRRHRSRRYY